MYKLVAFLKHRATVFILGILLQIGMIVAITLLFNQRISNFYLVMLFMGFLLMLKIVNSSRNTTLKMAWIVPILLFPVYSGLLYCLIESNRLSTGEKKAIHAISEKVMSSSTQNQDVLALLKVKDPCAGRQSSYIYKYAYCPPYENTKAEYFAQGEDFFQALKTDIASAQSYIFMEYFIIEKGKMWTELLALLVDRVSHGVEVKIILDDFASLFRISNEYISEIEALGIQIAVFNPLRPFLSLRYNIRDHRKITVIDGLIGYTGGCNIADEYINAYVRFGHWKDSAIRLEGEAVWSFAAMFLSLWEFLKGVKSDFGQYKPLYEKGLMPTDTAIVQPFSDEKVDSEFVGVNVYLNMIYNAQKSVYIKTPYLILDNEVFTALSLAAKSGVDVRLVTPGQPDKKIVHATSRSYYQKLLESGVKIYEYTPGFMHEKVIVVDNLYAVIGTINLDYRSFYFHMECGVWLYNAPCIQTMHDEFCNLLDKCHAVSLADCINTPVHIKFIRSCFRLFAPFM